MSARPWYKRNGGEFIMGTLHMPMEARLAYSLLIDMMNDRDSPVPDDAEFICGFTKFSKRMWRSVRDFLLNDRDASGQTRIFIDADGRLSNPRFARELAERRAAHENAVRAGRKGGKKSAEQRAAQAEMDLEKPIKTPKRARKDDISASFRQDKLDENEPAPQENNDLAQAPPQATRARVRVQRPEKKKNQTNEHDSTRARARGPAATLARSDNLDDIRPILERCCEAAGWTPSSPPQTDRAFEVIRQWQALGVDFETVVIPTIRATVANSTDPTSSLNRFNRTVRHEHARLSASRSTGKSYRPPPSPILTVAGEPEVMTQIRTDLAKAIGPALYAIIANDVRMSDNGEGVLVLNGSTHHAQKLANEYGHKLKPIAKAHGFRDVW